MCLVVLVVDPRGTHNWIVINLTAYQVVIGALHYPTNKVVQLQYKVVACSALLWLVGWAALCWFSQLRWELFCNIILSGYCGREQTARQFILWLQQQLRTMNGSRWSSMVVHCGSAEVAIDGNIMTTVWGTLQGIVRDSPLTNIVCTILHFKRFNRRTEQGRQATLLPSSTSIYGHDLQIGHLDSIIA